MSRATQHFDRGPGLEFSILGVLACQPYLEEKKRLGDEN